MRDIPDYFRAEAFEDESDSKLKGSFTGSWLLDQVFPQLVYVVDGIIPEGLTLLVADPRLVLREDHALALCNDALDLHRKAP